MLADQVCLVDQLWRRAQDGPFVFGRSDRFHGLESLSKLTHSETGRPHDLRFGELPDAAGDPGDLQANWLRSAVR